jgi:plastocyanin
LCIAGIAAAALAAGMAPSGGAHGAGANVSAEGNAFTGGLQFAPNAVTVYVGQSVHWTNTDQLVPHTATEDHGLWDLSGTSGVPPYQGFGPGEVRERVFEAGTHHYYCRVHPADMKGVVSVPVTISVKQRRTRKKRRYSQVTVIWASDMPAEGEVFDVERKRGNGEWLRVRLGTRDPRLTFRSKRGVAWAFRARLRKAGDEKAVTDWSPEASTKA